MIRHAELEFGSGLLQPIKHAGVARQIVDHQFAATRERGDPRPEPQIVAERAERMKDGALQPPSRAPSSAPWRTACCR